MKLYAITTSERASKGQGGNEYVNIEMFVGESKHPMFIGKVKMYIENDLYCVDYYPGYDNLDIKPLAKFINESKGKQKKGEKCKDITCINCDSTMEGLCDNCR